MAITRHFLGWDRPALHTVVAHLVQDLSGPTLDLSDAVVIVPTRHSGRRLREALAQAAAAQGAGVIPPRVMTPESFLAHAASDIPTADSTESVAAWCFTLARAQGEQLTALFPSPPREDFGWRLSCAERFHRLQRSLAENGWTIISLAAAIAGEEAGSPLVPPGEQERWQDLATIEADYLTVLGNLGLRDPNHARIEALSSLSLPEGCCRIVVPALPDPLPLFCHALRSAAAEVPVEILVQAPADLASDFDDLGRPLQEVWATRRIPLPDESIRFVAGPTDQAEEAVKVALSLAPGELAIGAPDTEVLPFLDKSLAHVGLTSYNPAGNPLRGHTLAHLLESVGKLVSGRAFRDLAALLRHPDYLRFLRRENKGLSFADLLAQADEFQNEHLPRNLADVQRHLGTSGVRYPAFAVAIKSVTRHVAEIERAVGAEGFLAFMAKVYAGKKLDRNRPEDRRFQAAARDMAALLCKFDGPLFEALELTRADRLQLMQRSLQALRFYPERESGSIELLGWLELQWEDVPTLVVTGMNDGSVPEAVVGDAFLPDSLRGKLGLRSNDSRFARDAYLLSVLLHSRSPGAVLLVVGKTTAQGDPRKPSRLLFLCPDEELPGRTLTLFGDVQQRSTRIVPSYTWKLRPAAAPCPETLSVTSFKSFLACPFRFYLTYLLRMAECDDRATELDAMLFGSLCHHVLEAFGRSAALKDSDDPAQISAFLRHEASAWVHGRYGPTLPLPVEIQYRAALKRLHHVARVQAQERSDGWRIVSAEQQLGGREGLPFAGLRVRGKVDRIDRHEDGRVRLLDYKTSDSPTPPAKAHLRGGAGDADDYALVEVSGKVHRWADLQLPLYKLFIEQEMGESVACGYFNIPKAVTETGIAMWEELDSTLVDEAAACAEAIIGRIVRGEFWPAAGSLPYDDFEEILIGGPEISIDEEWQRRHSAEDEGGDA